MRGWRGHDLTTSRRRRHRRGPADRLRRARSGRRTSARSSQIVTAGRRIPPERLEEVAHHYELIGGRSPLNELTRRQAEGLRAALAADGRALPVCVGMRNWQPFLHETLAEMSDRGCRRALGIILSSLQTEASWSRYVEDVAAAREKVGPDAPEVVYAPPWREHPRFIEAMADRARAALAAIERRAPGRRARSSSPPTASRSPWPAGSPYAAQLETAARAIAAALGRSRAGRSPTRAAAARRAIRGSSPTSATSSARWRGTARATSWSSRSASSATTSRCSTTSTSRRRRWPSLRDRLPSRRRRQRPPRVHRDARRPGPARDRRGES